MWARQKKDKKAAEGENREQFLTIKADGKSRRENNGQSRKSQLVLPGRHSEKTEILITDRD